MEIGHCLDNASTTVVTLPSGEQFLYRGNVAVAAEEWHKLELVPPERVAFYDGGVWESLGAEAVENAARGVIDFAPRRDYEHMRSECCSIVAHKSRCAYCGALTVDDSRGNCGACGGPR